jgi:hypothetical protein
MQRARAAERHHAAGAIVEAALAGVDAEGARHVLADDVMDAPGRAHEIEVERLGDAVAHRGLGGGAVERHGAAEEEAGIEVAEHEVGVRQRRPGSALAIAGGPRIGAGAARADAQEAAVVDLGDAAPPAPISIMSMPVCGSEAAPWRNSCMRATSML